MLIFEEFNQDCESFINSLRDSLTSVRKYKNILGILGLAPVRYKMKNPVRFIDSMALFGSSISHPEDNGQLG